MGRHCRLGILASVILGALILSGCSTDDPNEPLGYSGSASFFVKNGFGDDIKVVVESSFGFICDFGDGVLPPGERRLICITGGGETPSTVLASLKVFFNDTQYLIVDHTPVVDSAWDQYEGSSGFDVEYEFFPHGL